jgi:predicted N-acetyltransferase YhbS
MTEAAPQLPVLADETPFDAAAIARVVDRAFGPGRYAKTAERLREDSEPIAGLAARIGREVIGSVRLWPVTAGEVRAAFLGPIAVEAAWRSGKVGASLVEACIERARALGLSGVLLVGDAPYFGRFGFEVAPLAVLPGPVDQRRVLWLSLDGSTAEGGVVRG